MSSTVPLLVNDGSDYTLFSARMKKRVLALSANSATPAIDTDNYDLIVITGQSANITSFTSGLTGTPNEGDRVEIRITSTTTITLTWGASFGGSQTSLPSGITGAATVSIMLEWQAAAGLWVCMSYT